MHDMSGEKESIELNTYFLQITDFKHVMLPHPSSYALAYKNCYIS